MRSVTAQPGFTLIELLIVVAIIGILAAIAVPNFLNARVRAEVARVHADFRSIRTALELYRADCGSYIHGWSARFQQLQYLTTPIKYLSTAPVDRFVPPGVGSQGELRIYDFAGCCVGDSEYYDLIVNQIPGRIDHFLLASYGPDLALSVGYAWYYPKIDRFAAYEPTNGLRSVGDILYETNPSLNVPPLQGPAVNPLEPRIRWE